MYSKESAQEPRPGREEGGKYALQPDFVYPPPPSYYENLPEPSVRLPLPPSSSVDAPNQVPADLYGYAATSQSAAPQTGTSTPAFPAGPAYMQQPPTKQSAKWRWLLIAIVGSALLLSCGLCGWAFASTLNVTYQRVMAASSTVDDFYQSVQKNHYSAAYVYLVPTERPGGLTLSDFTQQVQQREASYGPIVSYTLQQPAFGGDSTIGLDFSRLLIPVAVQRNKLTYTATLTLSKINGSWKIVGFDQV